ncbi:MAG: hypothetical protein IT559_00275 [Alphaproteobacteria bacterium]|nr:hypothetical protein [Alphaproteobacteria bacterium]
MQPLIVFIVALLVFIPSKGFGQIAGTLDYDTAINRYKYYDGAQWVNLGTPILLNFCNASHRGEIEYDTTLNTLKYCNGTIWLTMAGLPTLATCSKQGAWQYSDSLNRLIFCNGLLWILMA